MLGTASHLIFSPPSRLINSIIHEHSCKILYFLCKVIKATIQEDLKKTIKAVRDTEQQLRAERVRLIRAKVEESGGDVRGLTEAGKNQNIKTRMHHVINKSMSFRPPRFPLLYSKMWVCSGLQNCLI